MPPIDYINNSYSKLSKIKFTIKLLVFLRTLAREIIATGDSPKRDYYLFRVKRENHRHTHYHCSNNMCGREEFRIHSDRGNHPGAASEGCIIAIESNRITIWDSGDKELIVK
ncbi:DUF2778 domain-containing protein [Rahnella sp. SAP-1]|uniref:DUF2778 domain-containing protein n=1 Tax=Rouxiella aceris TaxID=2703884 RepID=A0A848MR47_9GAMM|nr:DUF2778 domain-containing protein [Rouxiella aceris]